MSQSTIASPADISPDLIDAIRLFPADRDVEHCGVRFPAPSLAFYATCPQCSARVKLRGFSAQPGLADVLDAVFEWIERPENTAAIHERLQTLKSDD